MNLLASAATTILILIIYTVIYWLMPMLWQWQERSNYLKAVAISHAVVLSTALAGWLMYLLTNL